MIKNFKKKIAYPKISIIVPTCAPVNMVQRFLKNLIQLDYPYYDIIVAYNGDIKNPNWGNYLKEKKIKILQTTPFSKTRAANVAAKHAQGDVLFFIDSDAEIRDYVILSQVALALSVNSMRCLTIKFKNEFNGYVGEGGRLFIPSRDLFNFIKAKKKKHIDYPQGFAFALLKNHWDTIGGYDEKVPFGCEEIDIGFKLKHIGVTCELFDGLSIIDKGVPQGKVGLLGREGNDIDRSARKHGRMIFGKLYFINKYYSSYDFILIVPLLFLSQTILSFKKIFATKSSKYLKEQFRAYFQIIETIKQGTEKK